MVPAVADRASNRLAAAAKRAPVAPFLHLIGISSVLEL
jgi:hypothetical protein